ncbi:hypothetical protein [Chitinophaga flava]|uniref:Uncharacterized protein n=1 Tax=Chitinophaga flava TaxID=2259036 RepID=A0A365XPF5_9BACT|nr:hypothetical protein [Chitinophaga flava]RBL88233.1 hypothetical protein DF182_16675 [Chitinophaga flava]
MKNTNKLPLLLLASFVLLLLVAGPQYASAKIHYQPVADTSCLVKHETSFEFPDGLRKKVHDLIEDKVAGGIDEKGITTWENSPDAPEYYQIVLRKNKITIKYKGNVCDDKLIAENIEACKSELQKLIGK